MMPAPQTMVWGRAATMPEQSKLVRGQAEMELSREHEAQQWDLVGG